MKHKVTQQRDFGSDYHPLNDDGIVAALLQLGENINRILIKEYEIRFRFRADFLHTSDGDKIGFFLHTEEGPECGLRDGEEFKNKLCKRIHLK